MQVQNQEGKHQFMDTATRLPIPNFVAQDVYMTEYSPLREQLWWSIGWDGGRPHEQRVEDGREGKDDGQDALEG